MPTYEYECKACGEQFECFQSMMDKPLTTCSRCGGAVRRLIGLGAGIILKNSDSNRPSPLRGSSSACSLETSGRTCCGRDERCDSPHCEAEQ